MELNHHVTQDVYVDYLIATQNSWEIFDLIPRKTYYQAIQALAKSTKVKHLHLNHGTLEGGLTESDYFQLARSLDANNSLEHLILNSGPIGQVGDGVLAVLNVLVRKSKINSFECYGIEFSQLFWQLLLDYVRAHPNLKKLSLPNAQLTEQQVVELMELLQTRLDLISLNLFGNSGTFNSLKAVAQYVSMSTKLNRLAITENELTAHEEAQILEIMQKNTSLTEMDSYPGFIGHSAFIVRNAENNRIAKAVARGLIEKKQQKPDSPILIESDPSQEPGIHKIPVELLRVILWQLPITTLIVVKRVCKQFRTFMKDKQFWRDYYLIYHSSIPENLLSLTDLTYGLKLMAAKSMEGVSTLWEEIVINSYRSRESATYFTQFLEPVYRQYPQLIGTANSAVKINSVSPDRSTYKWKDVPYANTWFVAYANNSTVYHLGFEKLHDGQYNGILLLTPDMQEWNDRFHDMRFIYEWFAAKNESEFAEKMKPLCEVFLAARKSKYQNMVATVFYKNINGWMHTAIRERQRIMGALGSKIEQSARQYWAKQGGTTSAATFVKQVTELTALFKDTMKVPDSELEQYRQHIPSRSTLNVKYNLPNQDLFYNFDSHDWSSTATKIPKYSTKHRKNAKKIPLVVLVKLYRVVLNSILMPMLKIFWPADFNHPDHDVSHHIQWTNTVNLYQELFDIKSYKPVCNISISKAYPAQWPLIAVGLAELLLPNVVAIVDEALDGCKVNLSASLAELLNSVNTWTKYNKLI